MPIAKDILKIGSIVVARPGNFVAPSAVEYYGWHDKVIDDNAEAPEPTAAPKRRARKKTE